MRVLLLLVLLATGVGVVGIQELYPHRPATEGIKFRFNEGFPSLSADAILALSFGYSRVMSGLLWLRFLQHTPPERIEKDEVSWIYLDLDAISTIDPDFVPTFEEAAIFLSVVTDDKLGAQKILEKGVRLHPDRWRIRAYLGYHYRYELNDIERAKEQFIIGAKIPGAAPLMTYMAATLIAEENSAQESVRFLQSMKDSMTDEKMKERIEIKIQEWKRRIATGVKK